MLAIDVAVRCPVCIRADGIDDRLHGLIRDLIRLLHVTPVAGDLGGVLSLEDGGGVGEIGRLPGVDE